jgi:hypothetical protein
MPTEEIPLKDWESFFAQFSRQHEGWQATVAILGGGVEAGIEARHLPLVGISLDTIDGTRTIAIMLGETVSEHLTHMIAKPKYVGLKQTEQGAHEALVIESEDGVKTLLRFRSTMPTEMLDGVLPDRPGGTTAAGAHRSRRETAQ